MSDDLIKRLEQTLSDAPRPSTRDGWLIEYADWYFRERLAVIELARPAVAAKTEA